MPEMLECKFVTRTERCREALLIRRVVLHFSHTTVLETTAWEANIMPSLGFRFTGCFAIRVIGSRLCGNNSNTVDCNARAVES